MAAPAVLQASTVAIGRAFEERCLSILHTRLSMSLRHVGSKGDGGVDLQGWWWLPRLPSDTTPDPDQQDRRRIRILAQCKALKQKLGPIHVRELEGAALLHSHTGSARIPNLRSTTTDPEPAPALEEEQTQTPDFVAMLLSSSGFSRDAIRRTMSSPVPFLLLHLPAPQSETETETAETTATHSNQLVSSQPLPASRVTEPVGSILWNTKLSGTGGLLGGHMEVRWELGRGGRPVLYWRNKRLKHWVPEMEPEAVNSRFTASSS